VEAAGIVQGAAAAGAAAQQDAFGYSALQQQQQQQQQQARPLPPPQQQQQAWPLPSPQQQQQQARPLPSPQQQQPQQQLQLFSVQPGITVIKDAASMNRLVATLAAAPSWGFSLHLDQPAPATAAAVRVKKSSNRIANSIKDYWTAAAGPAPAARTMAAAASTQWRWDVLGAAFSTADGSAFYVPLYVGGGGVGPSKGIAVRRGGSPDVLQRMWTGLKAIFSSSSPQQQQQQQQQEAVPDCIPGTYLQSRVAELAAAARSAADGSGSGSDTAHATSASAAADSSWLTPAPVAVTFGAKQALKLLSDPPAASRLPGLRLCGSLVDVRVAAWLLAPEASVVEESVGNPGCK
jgi:hypothetical protein